MSSDSLEDDSTSLISQILEIEEGVLSSPSRMRPESKRMLLQLNRIKQSILEHDVVNNDEMKATTASHNDAQTITLVSPGLCSKLERSKRATESSPTIQSFQSWPLTRHSRGSSGATLHPYLPRNLMMGDQALTFQEPGPPVPPLVEPDKVQPPNSILLEDDSLTIMDDISSLRSSYTPSQSTMAASRVSRQAKKMEKSGYSPDLELDEEHKETCAGSTWNIFSFLVTFFVPDVLVPARTLESKQAWREKVAVCVIFLIISACFLLAVSLPVIYCQESDQYFDSEQISSSGWTTIFGEIYDLQAFSSYHPGGLKPLESYYGVDASPLFPRLPPTELPMECLNPLLKEEVFNSSNSLSLQNVTCLQISKEDRTQYRDFACHESVVGMRERQEALGEFVIGKWVISGYDLGPNGLSDGTQFIVIDDNIYNVTQYVERLKLPSREIDANHEANEYAFLNPAIHNLIVNKLNEDASVVFNELFYGEDKEIFRECMNELFYHAHIDPRFSQTCNSIGIAQYILVAIFSFLVFVQIICSLAYIAKRPPFVKDTDVQAAVMIMVPTYNESATELRKTIDSVLQNEYPDENKVIVIVCDGVVTGKGEKLSTPQILGKILGFEFDPVDAAYPYRSLGTHEQNYASLYSGQYCPSITSQKILKFIVVVKQGSHSERYTPRAGNRGKRDSQLLLLGIFNRFQYHRRPTALDAAFMTCLDELQLSLGEVEFLMTIDADTRVSTSSMKYLVHQLEHNHKIVACCGETRVDNKSQSVITMMQVFEYYAAHHMKKAFESLFGCVTCLPGCFSLYRLYSGNDMEPLVASDVIMKNYSRNDIGSSMHLRNLYELGEDRMLTTLLLQHFYGMRLNFVPEATCWTIVPHTFRVLVSQRRRWINSTIHNMLELMKVQTMCGVCVFSMKVVVISDLLSTFLLPSGSVYLYYVVVSTAITREYTTFSLFIVFSCLAALMTPFIFRAQWQYFFWFFVYLIVGLPVFYIFLPLYAFWHMDDLSWGQTRQVKDESDQKMNLNTAAVHELDESATSIGRETSHIIDNGKVAPKNVLKKKKRKKPEHMTKKPANETFICDKRSKRKKKSKKKRAPKSLDAPTTALDNTDSSTEELDIDIESIQEMIMALPPKKRKQKPPVGSLMSQEDAADGTAALESPSKMSTDVDVHATACLGIAAMKSS